MENQNKKKLVYSITDEIIQAEAEQEIDRQLSKKELARVVNWMECNSWPIFEFIRSSINNTLELDELIKKSALTKRSSPYFKLYHRNSNEFQRDFKFCTVFKSLEDTKRYIQLNWSFVSEFDQWKISKVDGDKEYDVEIIGQGRDVDTY